MTGLVAVTVAVPTAVWATTTFNDVPSSSPFYKDITAVAGAGITNGFADGGFHPSDPVTRQAMAAFTHRAGGRIAEGGGVVNLQANQAATVGTATMDAGGSTSGTGFVHLLGSVYAHAPSTQFCPCQVTLELWQGATRVGVGSATVPTQSNYNNPLDQSGGVQAVVSLAAGTRQTYRLSATLNNSSPVEVTGDLTATYEPFSGNGTDSTAAPVNTCPRDDGYENNDSQAAGTPLFVTNGGTETPISAIACLGDADWYAQKHFLGYTHTMQVSLAFTAAEGNIDACIVNSAGVDVVCGSSTGDNESVSYSPSPSTFGLYSVRVFLESDSGTESGNQYTLNVQQT